MSSMNYNAASGISGMLKDGHSHWDDAVVRNIDAATELSAMVCTSLGPFGRHKLLVNHLEQMSITSDCATIIKQLEVEHPAAKLLALASAKQKEECGDATNLVVTFAGELLRQTTYLMKMGLHVSEVISGYQTAANTLWKELPLCAVPGMTFTSKDDLIRIVSPVLGSKQYGSHHLLAPLVVEAGLTVSKPSEQGDITAKSVISPDAVRTLKVLGGSVSDTQLIRGYVSQRPVASLESMTTKAKVAVFACGFEASSTEAKGTVLMKTAADLKNYNASEEIKMEEIVQSIMETGVKVLVVGGSVSEMALHFINRYKLILIKISSKWELRRLCQAVGATALVRLGPPTPDECGYVESVYPLVLGKSHLTVLENRMEDTKLATLILRASTHSMLQDMERAVDDGIHALHMASKFGALCVPGAGATEFHLSQCIYRTADTAPGLDQYAIRAFGTALQIIPRVLAETAGWNGPKLLADMSATMTEIPFCGIHLEEGTVGTTDILDLLATKTSAMQLALDAALTVLRVDQIIMSKQSGGPRQ